MSVVQPGVVVDTRRPVHDVLQSVCAAHVPTSTEPIQRKSTVILVTPRLAAYVLVCL